MCDSVALSPFTRSRQHHLCFLLEHFCLPLGNPVPMKQLPGPLPQPMQPLVCFCLHDFVCSGYTFTKATETRSDHMWPLGRAPFTSHPAFEAHAHCGMRRSSSPSHGHTISMPLGGGPWTPRCTPLLPPCVLVLLGPATHR